MSKITIYEGAVEGGKLVTKNPRTINPSVCPHFIFMPEHYREDGTCKCDNPDELVMKEWGYRWSKKNKKWGA